MTSLSRLITPLREATAGAPEAVSDVLKLDKRLQLPLNNTYSGF